jgi:DNA-binding GntR family transcriptional regulator
VSEAESGSAPGPEAASEAESGAASGAWVSSSAAYLAPRDADAPDPWRAEAEQAGRVGGSRLIGAGPQLPSERVARLLRIEPGSAAVLRRRLVTLDDAPVEVSDSWYPLDIAGGTALAEERPIKGGALRALTDLGYVADRHVEEVAVVDTPEAFRSLLPDPVVLELTRVSLTATGVPFEVAVMLMTREMAPGVPRRLRYEFGPRG